MEIKFKYKKSQWDYVEFNKDPNRIELDDEIYNYLLHHPDIIAYVKHENIIIKIFKKIVSLMKIKIWNDLEFDKNPLITDFDVLGVAIKQIKKNKYKPDFIKIYGKKLIKFAKNPENARNKRK